MAINILMYNFIKEIFEAYKNEYWDSSTETDEEMTSIINDAININSPVPGLKRIYIPVDLSDETEKSNFITDLQYNINAICTDKKYEKWFLNWIENKAPYPDALNMNCIKPELIEYYCLALILYSIHIKDNFDSFKAEMDGKIIGSDLKYFTLREFLESVHETPTDISFMKNTTFNYNDWNKKFLLRNKRTFDVEQNNEGDLYIQIFLLYIKYVYEKITGKFVENKRGDGVFRAFLALFKDQTWNWDKPWNWAAIANYFKLDYNSPVVRKQYIDSKKKWRVGNTYYKLSNSRYLTYQQQYNLYDYMDELVKK